MFRQIDESMLLAGQIYPEDVAAAAREGVMMIVNNRPDGEQPGQPASAEIEAAATAAGIGYRYVPVGHSFSREQVAAMADALAAQPGPVLAFCAAGTRSAFLWALTRAQAGDDPDTIIAKAAAAGFDLEPLRTHLGQASR